MRVLYVEMLGQDASFGYMAAVQMTPSENLIHKRVGYLVSGLCLDPGHDFRFMLVNQLQRDLKSSNHVSTASALQAVCRLVTNDMIPPMLPLVVDLLKHEQANVRKKAAMTLHRFHQLNPASVAHLEDNFRRTLCDADPSVMGAVLASGTSRDLGACLKLAASVLRFGGHSGRCVATQVASVKASQESFASTFGSFA